MANVALSRPWDPQMGSTAVSARVVSSSYHSSSILDLMWLQNGSDAPQLCGPGTSAVGDVAVDSEAPVVWKTQDFREHTLKIMTSGSGHYKYCLA
ncbi:hypothetical protein EJB05_26509, partial [Eragrostis curvula]